jgi:hypothetical protein
VSPLTQQLDQPVVVGQALALGARYTLAAHPFACATLYDLEQQRTLIEMPWVEQPETYGQLLNRMAKYARFGIVTLGDDLRIKDVYDLTPAATIEMAHVNQMMEHPVTGDVFWDFDAGVVLYPYDYVVLPNKKLGRVFLHTDTLARAVELAPTLVAELRAGRA